MALTVTMIVVFFKATTRAFMSYFKPFGRGYQSGLVSVLLPLIMFKAWRGPGSGHTAGFLIPCELKQQADM